MTWSAFARVWIVLFAGLLITSFGFAAEGLRTWTDATGKHKMEAKYTGMNGTKVKLTLKTGKKMEIELKQLSAADRKYVESLAEDSPFKAADEEGDSPFKSSEDESNDEAMEKESDDSESEDDGGRTKTVAIDWSEYEAVLLDPPGEEWTAEVGPSPGWGGKPKNIALPPKKDFFEGMKGVVVSQAAMKAVVGYRMGREEKDSLVRLVVCDLKTGKSGSVATDQSLMSPIALHDDGKQILMRHDGFGAGNQETLELWTIKGKTVQKKLSWIPFDEDWKANRDVIFAEFVDADHLLASSRNGRVALWDLNTAKPLWYFDTVNGAAPCLSGDRKTVGFCTADRVGLFNLEEQTVTAMADVPGNKLIWPITAFSPSGKRLACIAQSRVLVWDTSNGKLLYDFETPGLDLHWGIGFPDDNYLLGSNKYLIELENQIKLWEYAGAEQVKSVGTLTFAGLGAHNAQGALLSLELPHKGARDLLTQALTQPDLFVFREGTAVKLDVSGVPAADQGHVQEVLTKKLTEMKCPVAENGTITLVASVTGPKSRTVSYINSGDYTVQEYFTDLRFVYQGTPAWNAGSTNIPGFLSLNRGENIEGVLRKASEKPNISFYDGVILPKFLQKPSTDKSPNGRQTLGTSQLTTTGLK